MNLINSGYNIFVEQSTTNICITGGLGFIGSHVATTLTEGNHHLTLIDDLSSGSEVNLHSSFTGRILVDDFASESSQHTIQHDSDVLIHLAAKPSVQESFTKLLENQQSNYVKVSDVVSNLGLHRCKHIVFASSASVYGPSEGPVDERCYPNPQSPYAVDKLACEHLIKLFAHKNGFTYTILRFFNVYGPNQNPHSPYSGVISKFVNNARHHLPIRIYGDGQQTRDFIHVSDVAKIVSMATLQHKLVNRVVNVATGSSCSLIDIVKAIQKNSEEKLTVEHLPEAVGDIKNSAACIDSLIESTGYNQFRSLIDGIGDLCQK